MTIHIAGFPVRVGNHKRQLCAWCGHRIIDIDVANTACMGEWTEPGHYEPNALVRVAGENPVVSSVVEHAEGEPIPAGWCGEEAPRLRLVASVGFEELGGEG